MKKLWPDKLTILSLLNHCIPRIGRAAAGCITEGWVGAGKSETLDEDSAIGDEDNETKE